MFVNSLSEFSSHYYNLSVAAQDPVEVQQVAETTEVTDRAGKRSPQFVYRAGTAPEKTEFSEHSILTLNVCMLGRMDLELPKLYGGLTAPVSVRAQRLADFVKAQNPDIYLGQEITLESAQLVYEAMKDQYPHFWMGMGIEPGKRESCLFVASKHPILKEPIFVPFSDEMQRTYKFPRDLNKIYEKRIIDRGFFILETQDYFIVTSHLEPGKPEQSASYRRNQLKLITAYMDELAKEAGKPYLVAGDLNIERTAEENDEYSQSGIPDDYYDHQTLMHPEFDESTYTCTNVLEARANGEPEPTEKTKRFEIDDYVLVRKHYKDWLASMHVELIPAYDLSKDLDEALSDHNAYKAIFKINPPVK